MDYLAMDTPQPYPAQILALKSFKAQNRWSLNDIVDVCAKEGQITNLGTVKRIFSPGSESFNFKYATTLEPIIYSFNRLGAEIPEPSFDQTVPNTSVSDLAHVLEAFEHTRSREAEYLKAQLASERRQKFIVLGILIAYFIFELLTPFGMIRLVHYPLL